MIKTAQTISISSSISTVLCGNTRMFTSQQQKKRFLVWETEKRRQQIVQDLQARLNSVPSAVHVHLQLIAGDCLFFKKSHGKKPKQTLNP